MKTWPEQFCQSIQTQFGAESQAFFAALESATPVSIRLNPEKPTGHAHLPIAQASESIPWHPYGHYLAERPIFAVDPLWHGGAYYVQEASSMILAEVVKQSLGDRLHEPLNALDLCAAPGGKTTILLDTLSADSVVVANEVIRSRTQVLSENLERWGRPNIVITSAEVEQFSELQGLFDLILVDAPCSGEGMFRKDPEAALEWSIQAVEICAARQQRILAGAIALLAPGGCLIYSTCTFNTLENDENIAWLIKTYDLEIVELNLNASWQFAQTKLGQAALPHRVKGEGFYISALRKKGETVAKSQKEIKFQRLSPLPSKDRALLDPWLKTPEQFDYFTTKHGTIRHVPKSKKQVMALIEHQIPYCLIGCEIGEIKGKDLIPAHALAQSTSLVAPETIELSLEDALAYLRKQEISGQWTTGWKNMQYAGIGLGWAKVLPNRVNNYLPMERRLRMLSL
jgi:16S rRNA C967 or C1407 C5-methylase (RsmB/RsmF family)/NOL1/NOP2/fmu family ribosome biogenesis protein